MNCEACGDMSFVHINEYTVIPCRKCNADGSRRPVVAAELKDNKVLVMPDVIPPSSGLKGCGDALNVWMRILANFTVLHENIEQHQRTDAYPTLRIAREVVSRSLAAADEAQKIGRLPGTAARRESAVPTAAR